MEEVSAEACGRDPDGPQFDQEWQRRAFGLAVALSEFGHYPWEQFQQELIDAVGVWEAAPTSERASWSYDERWLEALTQVVVAAGLVTRDEIAALDDER